MTAWSPEHVAALDVSNVDWLPVIRRSDVVPIADDIDIWDSWPIRRPDGSLADVCGHPVWIALAAPAVDDPALRHDVATHRAFWSIDGAFVDLGPLFADTDPLGTRQWAGSTILDGDRLVAYYTAVGTVGAKPTGFRQRLAVATARLRCDSGTPKFVDWSAHVEIQPDPRWYDSVEQIDGEPGFIKAFRDPHPLVDPASGDEYLFFTGSLAPASSTTAFNGAIGVARRTGGRMADWEMLEPVVMADGVNNELERPHLVIADGLYYLFFSTQSRTFHPDSKGPTGLYGFVSEHVLGPYAPLNGHGLVFANPPERPVQAYSWLVLNDLSVVGFIDAIGIGETGEDVPFASRTQRFGGTFSPTVRIALDGISASLVT